MPGDNYYFASDFHLGIDAALTSKDREVKIVQWLNSIEQDAHTIFLVGDLFDFWFEYRTVVPKGYVRILGKLANLVDRGIKIEIFIGNHDMWMFDYFEKELGIPVHREPIVRKIKDHMFFIGHGDGLGPGDHGYKFIKRVFQSKICQWLFARLHPNFAIELANFWSGVSRKSGSAQEIIFEDKENEWLYHFSNEVLEKQSIDFFIFGHRHLPLDITLKNGKARYLNLGDWLHHCSYVKYSGDTLELNYFSS